LKLALESPTKMLENIQPFADFDWILGREFLKDAKYAAYYKTTGKHKFIDNSVNEDGEPITIEELKKVYEALGSGWIVSPDWIGDMQKTLAAYGECIKTFGTEQVVGVVQGSTFLEALGSISVYQNAAAIAVPYDILSSKEDPPWLMALRRALVVHRIPNNKYIHLLGFTTLDEFAYYTNLANVSSIDTGVPVWLGLEGKGIEEPINKKDPTYKKMDKLEMTTKVWPVIIRNIALLRRYIS